MKKYLAFPAVLCALCCCLLSGCGSAAPSAPAATPSPTPAPTATPAPVLTGFSVPVPEGFSPLEVAGTLAYYESEDGASICLTTSDKDPSFKELDTASLTEALRQTYSDQTRDGSLSAEILSSSTGPRCGYDSYRLDLTFKGYKSEFIQYFVGLDADQTYTWVFTGNPEQADVFEACIAGMEAIYE